MTQQGVTPEGSRQHLPALSPALSSLGLGVYYSCFLFPFWKPLPAWAFSLIPPSSLLFLELKSLANIHGHFLGIFYKQLYTNSLVWGTS